ncbi:MAG: hypothetical protein RB148_11725 [Armatimonadota bacterium]|nr:hypothetical protein [Armatimonadota bacterium]
MEEVLDQRLSAIERRLDGHGDRIAALERQQAAGAATLSAVQEDVREAKMAAERAASSVDQLKIWIMGLAATLAANLLYLLLRR